LPKIDWDLGRGGQGKKKNWKIQATTEQGKCGGRHERVEKKGPSANGKNPRRGTKRGAYVHIGESNSSRLAAEREFPKSHGEGSKGGKKRLGQGGMGSF